MESSVLTSLPLVFVAAGVTLLATSMALSRRARRYRDGMQTLLHLGSKMLDPLAIPAKAWPVLLSAGWQQLSVTGSWFGQTVSSNFVRGTIGALNSKVDSALVEQIESGDDIRLTIRLVHSARRGEERLFAEQLARVFLLLLETSVRTKSEALSVALAERARLSLYLQHDMRNLAQWVGWVGADFSACDDTTDLLAAAHRLKENAPLAQERAQRLIGALGKKPVSDNPREIDLRLAITKAAHLAGIEVILSGQSQAWMARGLLARVLDNLFSNLAPNWRETNADKPVLTLRTVAASEDSSPMAEIEFFSPWLEHSQKILPDRLFEPFASGRPGGLGLGLYQARKSLREAGGDLGAHATDTGLSFLLRMPAQAP